MAQWTVDALSSVGVQDVRAYETADGSKTVCGQIPGPQGAPTVLLYFHHDVQPASDEGWESPPWELTERNGRWYGRGAADCKGSLAAHLTALRALGDEPPVTVKIVGEGSEEQGTGGLEKFVPGESRPPARRRDPRLRHGQRRGRRADPDDEPPRDRAGRGHRPHARGPGALRDVRRRRPRRARGAHPHARHACGTTRATRRCAASMRPRSGRARRIRRSSSGPTRACSTASTCSAKPSPTRSGLGRRPPCSASTARRSPARPPRSRTRRARASTCASRPGWTRRTAQAKLIEHLQAVAPWNVRLDFEREADGEPFSSSTSGPGFEAMSAPCAAPTAAT